MANDTLFKTLQERGVVEHVIIPPDMATLLDSLNIVSTNPPQVQAATSRTLLGFASLDLEPLGPVADYSLTIDPLGGFQLDLTYRDAFRLPASLAPARVVQNAGPDGVEKHLEPIAPAGGRVRLKNALVLRFAGEPGGVATQRILFPGAADELVALQCEPPAFLFGDTGFGLHLPGGLVIDDSATKAPTAAQHAPFPFASQQATWRGISIRGAELYLPPATPLIGKRPIPVDLEIGSPAGMDARSQVVIPKDGQRPEITATVEWHDPAATTFAIPPTMVELLAKVQIDGSETVFAATPVRLAGGNPLFVRGRYVRDAGGGQMTFSLTVEGGGEDGLVSVTARPNDTAPKVFVTAAAVATALIADSQGGPQPADGESGAYLPALLTAAGVLSDRFTDRGKVIVHGVEIEKPLGREDTVLHLRLDYSVDVVVKKIEMGPLRIHMDADVPMRIRYRDVHLKIDFQESGLEMFQLSFAGCSTLLEDPGGWIVDSPGSLLDVVGTRSGHGSNWFEVDLRFALDLGPIKVSGATVRATYPQSMGDMPTLELRGLAVEAKVPGLLSGKGQARVADDGFDASLNLNLDPLNLAAAGFLKFGGDQVIVDVGLDLPGPIPLANTGLGLFGIGGTVATNSQLPAFNYEGDVIEQQLLFKASEIEHSQEGGVALALGAVLGTLPDLGYGFSTKAMVLVATPDVTVRAALDARFISGNRAKMAEIGTITPAGGLRVLGLLVVGADALTLALRGTFAIPVLLDVQIPVAAHYPYGKSNWFLHIGSDGIAPRNAGPVRATILPDLINIGGYAYLMLQGDGIKNLGGTGFDLGGFSIGMGFGFDLYIPMGIVWLDMSARAVLGIATDPFMLIGLGGLHGTLHLGPFSLGVSADVKFQLGPQDARVFWLKVCGEVDLWFTTLRGCVEVGTDNIQDSVPDPGTEVLHRVGLTDWHGRELAAAVPGGPDAIPANLPLVWPDAIPVLEFVTGPKQTGQQGLLNRINKAFAGTGEAGTDELRYTYSLSELTLEEHNAQAGTWAPVLLPDFPFVGAWQVPKQNPSKPLPGARQLALLTGELHHWTRNLADGGSDEPDDPLKVIRDLCRRPRPLPVPGWALGSAARPGATTARWHIPGEKIAYEPFTSTFDVDVEVHGEEDREVEYFVESIMPEPFPMDPGGPVIYAAEIAGHGHTFSGALALPHVASPWSDNFADRHPHIAFLTFSEALAGATIQLLVPNDLDLQLPLIVRERPSTGPRQDMSGPDFFEGPPGYDGFVYRSTLGNARFVEIHYQMNAGIQLAGVSGITGTASNAVAEAIFNTEKGASSLEQLANTPPSSRKPVLKPGHTYRLTATVQRTGKRKNQDPVDLLPDQVRTYYFATAPLAPTVTASSFIDRKVLFSLQPSFDPKYLQRYVAGWTPVDKSTHWFRSDPVAVHFMVDHIEGLVDAYDHKIVLQARRTDTPPQSPDEGTEFFEESLLHLSALKLMTAADVRLHSTLAVAGQDGCAVPATGATLSGVVPLAANAQYDLRLYFPSKNAPTARVAELPGIHFSSSRYSDVAELLGALGFGPGGRVAGDIQLADVPPLEAAEGDRALEDALERLGLGQWPRTETARTSALWQQVNGSWKLRGVLLEAPEPIERFDPNRGQFRLFLQDITCAGASFNIVIKNASRSRLLFLAGAPCAPGGELRLTGYEIRPGFAIGAPPLDFTVTTAVAAVPAFVEDLL